MRTFTVDDGLDRRWLVEAPHLQIALKLLTPEGHRLERDTIGEQREAQGFYEGMPVPGMPGKRFGPGNRLPGWTFYFVIDGAGTVVDYFGIVDGNRTGRTPT